MLRQTGLVIYNISLTHTRIQNTYILIDYLRRYVAAMPFDVFSNIILILVWKIDCWAVVQNFGNWKMGNPKFYWSVQMKQISIDFCTDYLYFICILLVFICVFFVFICVFFVFLCFLFVFICVYLCFICVLIVFYWNVQMKPISIDFCTDRKVLFVFVPSDPITM